MNAVVTPNLAKQNPWMFDVVSMLHSQGYRAVPNYDNGKSEPYSEGQNYALTDPKWLKSNHKVVSAILDRVVLVDYDGNKPEGACPLVELQNVLGVDLDRHLVQQNKAGDSLHYLFKLPDGLDLDTIKASITGWMHGVDIKTKNQPIHLKQHKTIQDEELPSLADLAVVPDVVLDALKIEQSSFDSADCEKWDGNNAEITEAKTILSYIDPDCNYDDWSAVFCGITHKFGNTQQSIEILDEWSAEGEKYTSTADIAYKVNSYQHKGINLITFKSVCKLAENYGANLAKIAHKKERDQLEENYPSIKSCYEKLEGNDSDQAKDEAYKAAINHIANDSSDLARTRAMKRLKEITSVSMGDIKKSVKQIEKEDPLTHLDMAEQWGKAYSKSGLVAEYGRLWTYSKADGIWKEKDLRAIGIEIAEQFNKEIRCTKGADYKAIADVAYSKNYKADFFLNAPHGVNAPSGFYAVEEGGEIVLLPPNKDHRCTFRLSVDPVDEATPLFDALLSDAFGETLVEQRELLLQLIGCSLVGLLPSMQVAVFLYGVGGSGKSTVLKILESLVPRDSRCSVKPEDFGHEYHRAALAGKRFNLVPEIDKHKVLPSADFKAIVSGDSVSAREVHGKVFTMKPNAANWFNGNFFLTTRDRSTAFFRRWKMIHFMNAKPESDRRPDLDKKIIAQELGGILFKAIEAARDYLVFGELAKSTTHDRLMLEWRNSSNSVMQWFSEKHLISNGSGYGRYAIQDRAERSSSSIPPLSVTDAYSHYKDYCTDDGRKPFSRKEFKGYMGELGHIANIYRGYESYTGLTKKHPSFPPAD